MITASDYCDIIIDDEGFMLIKDRAHSVQLNHRFVDSQCLSVAIDSQNISHYSVVTCRDDKLFYLDPIKVCENLPIDFDETCDLSKFASINQIDLMDIFNYEMNTFSQFCVNYYKQKYNLNYDFVIGVLQQDGGYLKLLLHPYKYLWYPIPDGPKLHKSKATNCFGTLCYSAAYDMIQIGRSLTLANRISTKIDKVEIDIKYRTKTEQIVYSADQFAHLFKGAKNSTNTFYTFEAKEGILYVIRVEPNRYLTHPCPEPYLLGNIWKSIFG
jgi:hypothetical protein